MTRLKENTTKIQEIRHGNNQYIYKVVVPCKFINRNKLKKGDVFVWDDSMGEVQVKIVHKK